MSLKDSRSMWHFHTCKTSLSDSISNMDLEFLKLETLLFLNLLNRFYLTILNHYSHLFCTKPLLDKKYYARLSGIVFWGITGKEKERKLVGKRKSWYTGNGERVIKMTTLKKTRGLFLNFVGVRGAISQERE